MTSGETEKPIARERLSGAPDGGGGSGGGVDVTGGAVLKLVGGGEFVSGAVVTGAAGGAVVGAAELNSAGAMNDAWHSGQVVCLPARSSAMLIGSEQLG